jgi:hypothetical protein
MDAPTKGLPVNKPRIKSYNEGQQAEREAIKAWVKENRTLMGDPEEPWLIRDHFTFEDLIAFLDSRN